MCTHENLISLALKSSRLRDNIIHFSRDGSSGTDEKKHTTEYALA